MSKKMFPATLILEGRPCLIVGGGRVAARKGAKLAAAGATLTVVAPLIKESVMSLSGVRLIERAFCPDDIAGMFLVFALTDDSALNRRVVELCRQKGILCSAADASWPDGDLILPASFDADGLTVAIGTAGRSCRRSRMLRESLFRHVQFLQKMDLLILGADSNRCDFQTLEKLKAARPAIESALACLRGVHEFIILDTCNRFEVIGLVSACDTTETLLRGVMGPGAALQVARGADAFVRLVEIAAGLHSQALGETRIVAQIKAALAQAQDQQQAASFMQAWIDVTLCISKEIRSATAPLLPAFETEDLVFQWLETNRPILGKTLIIGRGEIGQSLHGKFPDAVQISGRSEDELRRHLPEAGLVICATSSDTFVIDEPHRKLVRDSAVLIDVSLPRNINPSLPGVVSLSDLRAAIRPETLEQVRNLSREILTRHFGDYERLIQFRK
ncbi:MAG: hypothetical protein IT583_02435, partial [Verrucomicrobia bacterium]|nr:hypothetical protein [Verrucomicrobiota bacterium]